MNDRFLPLVFAIMILFLAGTLAMEGQPRSTSPESLTGTLEEKESSCLRNSGGESGYQLLPGIIDPLTYFSTTMVLIVSRRALDML